MSNRRLASMQGFTIVEVLASLFAFGVCLAGITSIGISIQQAQRNVTYQTTATRSASIIIEQMRSRNNSDPCTDTDVDQTMYLEGTGLPDGHSSLKITCVNKLYGIRRLEVVVSYKVGSETRVVRQVAMIGIGGIYQ